MGIEEVRRMVMETIDGDLLVHKVWYNLKYDKQMLMPVEGDRDMRMIFKENDEHSYLYVGNNYGPRRTCCNPQDDFDIHCVDDVVYVEDLLDSSYVADTNQSESYFFMSLVEFELLFLHEFELLSHEKSSAMAKGRRGRPQRQVNPTTTSLATTIAATEKEIGTNPETSNCSGQYGNKIGQ
ncbi:hypothetical protein Cgig2_004477 [Carnegiea gigantea]|uniref:Uncharacterized protein n=1 Tax=Carnegiea gigantea TaxID=171969 RepID=A0A9Q1JHM6_9CARY|nr:hypothetical protein Cgig2_004477 [Carnegiea gigantea]